MSVIKEKTAKNAGVVMLGNFLALFLGLISSIVVAGQFGAGKELDAFMAAYMVPDILSQILMSIFVLVLIPTFLEEKIKRGEDAGWELLNKFITVSLVYLCFGGMLLLVFSPFVIKAVAPGFSVEMSRLGCSLLRILSTSVVLAGCLALGSSVLQAYGQFGVPSICRPLGQVVVIICVVGLAGRMGIYSYAVGSIMGLGIGLVAQMVAVFRKGRVKLDFDFRNPVVRRRLVSLSPLVLARLLNYGCSLIVTALASTFAIGSISALGFAWKIVSIPTLVLSSLSVVLYPGISEKIAKQDFASVGKMLRKAIRVSIFIGAPFTIFLIVAGTPVVRVLFERGNFGLEQSVLTGRVLMFYCVMIVFQSVNQLIGNTYWAVQLMRIRLGIEVLGVLLCIGLGLLWGRFFGAGGLALSISCQYSFLVVVGVIVLERRIPIDVDVRGVMWFCLRLAAPCLFMGVAVKGSMWVMSPLFEFGLLGRIGYVVSLVIIGSLGYVGMCSLMAVKENEELIEFIKGRILGFRRRVRWMDVLLRANDG